MQPFNNETTIIIISKQEIMTNMLEQWFLNIVPTTQYYKQEVLHDWTMILEHCIHQSLPRVVGPYTPIQSLSMPKK